MKETGTKLKLGFHKGMQSCIQEMNRKHLSKFLGINGVPFGLMMILDKAQLK